MKYLYYNILSNSTDAFLGTVAVELDEEATLPPASRARHLACDILGADGAPGGIRAILSTEEMFEDYGLHTLQDDYEDDGQPSSYEEYQDLYGGDDYPEQWEGDGDDW